MVRLRILRSSLRRRDAARPLLAVAMGALASFVACAESQSLDGSALEEAGPGGFSGGSGMAGAAGSVAAAGGVIGSGGTLSAGAGGAGSGATSSGGGVVAETGGTSAGTGGSAGELDASSGFDATLDGPSAEADAADASVEGAAASGGVTGSGGVAGTGGAVGNGGSSAGGAGSGGAGAGGAGSGGAGSGGASAGGAGSGGAGAGGAGSGGTSAGGAGSGGTSAGGAGSGGTSAGGAGSGGTSAGGAGSGGTSSGGAGSGGAGSGGTSVGGAGSGGASAGGAGSGGTSSGGAGSGGTSSGGADSGSPLGWVYHSVPGALCRDGSPAGYFTKHSDASSNLMIFLEGGGVCTDDFFCGINPRNVNERVVGETVLEAGFGNFGGPQQIPQTPPADGVFKDDARNPVQDWSMVYVPYCTGDVYGGTRTNVSVPNVAGLQQFVGYYNVGLFLDEIAPLYADAPKVLLTGSSAGGYGALINADRTQQIFTDSTLYVVSDSGPPFDDPYLETCLQKKWRDLWGLNNAFPQDCSGCFNVDGGGIAKGLATYLFTKYTGRVLGGLVSSNQDEIIKLFYSKGLDNCLGNPFYPVDRYPNGLHDLRDNIVDKTRFSTYFLNMSLHMHLFRSRFYELNGLTMTMSEWLGRTLNGESVHLE